MTEIGTIMVFECAHQPGGTHIIEDHVIEEVLDPLTLDPVGFGERGERVVTSFGRGAIPLLRYRTGDLVRRVPAATCTCGRGFDIYEGGILGRVDDMKLIRGTNVYPRAIEAIVREFPEVEEFQTVIFHEGIRDEIKLRLELSPESSVEAWDRLHDELHRRLAHAHEGLNFHLERAAHGELPRFELKAKRMTDLRETPAPPAVASTPAVGASVGGGTTSGATVGGGTT
jgi:phenylacetate-CoA ligase